MDIRLQTNNLRAFYGHVAGGNTFLDKQIRSKNLGPAEVLQRLVELRESVTGWWFQPL
jgi:hypothetical protein